LYVASSYEWLTIQPFAEKMTPIIEVYLDSFVNRLLLTKSFEDEYLRSYNKLTTNFKKYQLVQLLFESLIQNPKLKLFIEETKVTNALQLSQYIELTEYQKTDLFKTLAELGSKLTWNDFKLNSD
jgi:hypothetical protein